MTCSCGPKTLYKDLCEPCSKAFDEAMKTAAYCDQRNIKLGHTYTWDMCRDGEFRQREI